jgi:prepilin-type N-terminal cleavage/methylation domain-containing protein
MKLKQMKQKGFTMIELVIVIAILGVLAAFALPRFANFKSQSSDAAANSIVGTLTASQGIVKAKYIAGGSNGTTVDMNGVSIPVTSTGDINMNAMTDTATCNNLTNGLLTNQTNLRTFFLSKGICQIDHKAFIINMSAYNNFIYLK